MISIHAFLTAWRTTKKSHTESVQGIEIVHLYTEDEYNQIPLAVGIPIENTNIQ